MDLIITLVVGGVVGWLASLIMKTNVQMRVLWNVVVGIVGSSLGAFLARAAGFSAYGAVGRLIVAVVGASLLIAILKVLKILR